MPRKVKVVTTTLHVPGPSTPQAGREKGMDLLDLACTEKPDVVCLPEVFALTGVSYQDAAEVAEPVPGPTTDQAAQRARRHRTYVVCPLLRRADDGRVFNSAVILDRQGQVAGVYDKLNPVTNSAHLLRFERGVTPGSGVPVFELDFGRVGAQICFDLGFPDAWAELDRQKAELVFWPSAFDGGLALQAYAYRHQYYIVSSVSTPHAGIINPVGQVLARTATTWPLAVATIDLDFLIVHPDYNAQRLLGLKRKYGDGVIVRACEEEGCLLLESNLADQPVGQIAREFGLESFRRYHDRHREPLQALREGRQPQPQEPPLY